nr:glypican-1 [Loxodonta africana]
MGGDLTCSSMVRSQGPDAPTSRPLGPPFLPQLVAPFLLTFPTLFGTAFTQDTTPPGLGPQSQAFGPQLPSRCRPSDKPQDHTLDPQAGGVGVSPPGAIMMDLQVAARAGPEQGCWMTVIPAGDATEGSCGAKEEAQEGASVLSSGLRVGERKEPWAEVWLMPVEGGGTSGHEPEQGEKGDHFQRLLNGSERVLQDTFPSVFGDLYTHNAKAFRDLYAELRLYYRGANLHLEETLAEFWARLLERLFRQLHQQLLLPDDYLDCLGKQAEALRPFGEVPRELRLRATRAFVAARAFVQGLGVATDVVRKVAQVPLGPECSRAVMKLVYCAHCLGVPGARPCPDYCRNVLKGCLANQADLDAEWRNLLDSMVLITDKFWGPSGAESVISSVHIWLAEAINTLQDNKDTLTAKVIQGCGNPKVNSQSTGPEEKRRRGQLEPQEKPPTGTLEKLVSEAKAQLRDIQDFWISLPGTLCSERVAMSTASDDRCWNGMTKGR